LTGALARIIRGGWQLHARSESTVCTQTSDDLTAYAAAGVLAFETSDTYRNVDEVLRDLRKRIIVKIHTRITINPEDAVDDALLAARVDAQRRSLDMDRLDVLQLSMWGFSSERWRRAAAALASLRSRGVIGKLGVMNVDAPAIALLHDDGIHVDSVQAQFSLLDRRAMTTLLPFCRAHGIAFYGYGALAGGFIAERWHGASDPGFGPQGQREYRAIIDHANGWPRHTALLATLHAIAGRHQASISDIALRWALDQNGVSALLVGASSSAHLQALKRLDRIALTASDRALIDTTLAQLRIPAGPVGHLERDASSLVGRALRGQTPGSDPGV
jgi:aryl-alcohol dehydrogenase-like predicted oxidoreductase